MSAPVDFIIYGITDFPGISVVTPRTEKAYDYMAQQNDMNVLNDGSAPIPTDLIDGFIDDTSLLKLTCKVV